MWSKYTFVCDPDECDALLEFTARDGYGFPNGIVSMQCPCGRTMQYIHVEDLPEIPPKVVTDITSPQVVKINTNPYN